jgi:hypothetical protein
LRHRKSETDYVAATSGSADFVVRIRKAARLKAAAARAKKPLSEFPRERLKAFMSYALGV